MLYTPLCRIKDFLKMFADVKQLKSFLNERMHQRDGSERELLLEHLQDMVQATTNINDTQLKMKVSFCLSFCIYPKM